MNTELSELIQSPLTEAVYRLYTSENTNCAETLLQACNEVYGLHLPEGSMRLFSAFGAGMYTGNVCGALSGLSAALSYRIVEDRAHTTEALRPAQQILVRQFKVALGHTQCPQCKMMHHSPERGCLKTCLLAAKAMEQTIRSLEENNLIAAGDFAIADSHS